MSLSPLRFVGGRPPPDILVRIAGAISDGDLARVQTLLMRWPDQLTSEKLWFGSWLHHAAKEPHPAILNYFLSQGLDVNAGDQEGIAPIACAALAGHYDNVKLLIDRGAVLDVSMSVRNPLFAAISGSIHLNASWPPPTGEAPKIVTLLLEAGIDASKRYNSGSMTNMDAVAFAVRMGALDLARIIALWNTNGDERAAEQSIIEAGPIAEEGLDPVPPDEQYRPS